MVVVFALKFDPCFSNFRKRGSSISVGVTIRDWLWSPLCGVEDTRVGEVEILRLRDGPLPKAITRISRDHGENVSPHVPAAECEQAPIRLSVDMK
jgi:hypothetical protein